MGDEFRVSRLGVTALPSKRGVTRATHNKRTLNVRLAMGPAREAMGDLKAGDYFETVAYPLLGVVVVRKVRDYEPPEDS